MCKIFFGLCTEHLQQNTILEIQNLRQNSMHNNKTLHCYVKYLLLLGTTVPHSSQEQRI